jgi:hypothetical protein
VHLSLYWHELDELDDEALDEPGWRCDVAIDMPEVPERATAEDWRSVWALYSAQFPYADVRVRHPEADPGKSGR